MPRISDEQINARFQALESQRNTALNEVVVLRGQIADMALRIKELESGAVPAPTPVNEVPHD